MKTINRELKNNDGTIDLVSINSNDDYQVNLDKNYILVGYAGNYRYDKFKNSLWGIDIGIKSYGFVSMILLSTILAISVIVVMYVNFKI